MNGNWCVRLLIRGSKYCLFRWRTFWRKTAGDHHQELRDKGRTQRSLSDFNPQRLLKEPLKQSEPSFYSWTPKSNLLRLNWNVSWEFFFTCNKFIARRQKLGNWGIKNSKTFRNLKTFLNFFDYFWYFHFPFRKFPPLGPKVSRRFALL